MIRYEEWKDKRENFSKIDVRHVQGNFFPGLRTRAAALKVGEGLGRIAADFWQFTWQSGKRREEICTELKEKFGEKNQKIQVL